MTEAEIDRRIGLLIGCSPGAADAAFADRVVTAARIDRSFRLARNRAWRRAVLDCAGAVTVAVTFYFLSQTEREWISGTLSLQGPAMAGLIMIALWAMVELPALDGSRLGRQMT